MKDSSITANEPGVCEVAFFKSKNIKMIDLLKLKQMVPVWTSQVEELKAIAAMSNNYNFRQYIWAIVAGLEKSIDEARLLLNT